MQKITHVRSSEQKDVVIERLTGEDFEVIVKLDLIFNWKAERDNILYKLKIEETDEIFGLMSLKHFEKEERFEIKLLETTKENVGKNKKYEGIAENLIAFACREAVKYHAENACVSLFPKTELKNHYMIKYGMRDAGRQLFLAGKALFNLIEKNIL